MKRALITGITGQDGSYLAELLLEKGYKVYGTMRRKGIVDYGNVCHIVNQIQLIYADLTDLSSLIHAVKISQPDEVYNLAAQSCCRGYESARSDSSGQTRRTFLSGGHIRNVWKSAADAADRTNAVLSKKSLWSFEIVWLLDNKKLSGKF